MAATQAMACEFIKGVFTSHLPGFGNQGVGSLARTNRGLPKIIARVVVDGKDGTMQKLLHKPANGVRAKRCRQTPQR